MIFTEAMLKQLETTVDTCMEAEFANDEVMGEFHTGDWFNTGYYKRHILECVIRIPLNKELDAHAVHSCAIDNIPAAKKLAYYLYDEFGHDEMFG